MSIRKKHFIRITDLEDDFFKNLEISSKNKTQSKFFKNLSLFVKLYKKIQTSQIIEENRRDFYLWTFTQALINISDNPQIRNLIDFDKLSWKKSLTSQESIFLSEIAWDVLIELEIIDKVNIGKITEFAQVLKNDYKIHNLKRKELFKQAYNSAERVHNISKAIECANISPCPYISCLVCLVLLPEKKFSKALEIAKMFPAIQEKEKMICIISTALAENNKTDEALKIVETITNKDIRAQTLGKISITLAENNKTDEALKIAKTINVKNISAQTLGKISQNLTKNNNIDKGLKIAERIPKKYKKHKEKALYEVVLKLIENNKIDEALEIAENLTNINKKDNVFCLIARELAQNRERIDTALKIAQRIINSYKRENAFYKICRLLIHYGRVNESLKIVNKLTTNLSKKKDILSTISQKLAQDDKRKEKILKIIKEITKANQYKKECNKSHFVGCVTIQH